MYQPPADLHPEARKVVDLFTATRWPGSKPLAYYRNLPPSDRLTYELLHWYNYRVLLDLFGQDGSPFVMPSLKLAKQLDEYTAIQLSLGRYSGKRGMCDWLLRLADGTYIGVLHLYNISLEIDKGKRYPCICGYAIAEPYRRQGYAEESLRHLLSRLPIDFKLFNVQAEPLEANILSRTLLEKVGFQVKKSFINDWGQAVLYAKKLVKRTPRILWKELKKAL